MHVDRNGLVVLGRDDFDSFSHTGWSVCVTGVARKVTDRIDLDYINRLPLAHWAPDAADHVIAMSTEIVTGRRIA